MVAFLETIYKPGLDQWLLDWLNEPVKLSKATQLQVFSLIDFLTILYIKSAYVNSLSVTALFAAIYAEHCSLSD